MSFHEKENIFLRFLVIAKRAVISYIARDHQGKNDFT